MKKGLFTFLLTCILAVMSLINEAPKGSLFYPNFRLHSMIIRYKPSIISLIFSDIPSLHSMIIRYKRC